MKLAHLAAVAMVFAFPWEVGAIDLSVVTRASVDSTGHEANGFSDSPAISANGRFVVFTSYASNLAANDTNGNYDIFVRDLVNGTTMRVSGTGSSGQLDSAWVGHSSISADGRYVAFASFDDGLVPNDTGHQLDVFLHDLETGIITRISETGGVGGNGWSMHPSISCDGRFVAFHSEAANLVAGDTNGAFDIFVKDRQTGAITRVSVSTSGTQANYNSAYPAIRCDGRFVAFSSYASNLVAGDTNLDPVTGEPARDIFVHDRTTSTTTRVSVDSTGAEANHNSCCSSISADGRFVAFASDASNLVPNDTNGITDVFVHDRQTGATTRVSESSAGAEGNDLSSSSSISANGRYVAFASWASNLVAGDTPSTSLDNLDVFVKDRGTGDVARIGGNRWSNYPSLSASGGALAFNSAASNLVTGDTNAVSDIFVANEPPLVLVHIKLPKPFDFKFIDGQRIHCMIKPPCGPIGPIGPDPAPWASHERLPGAQTESVPVALPALYGAAAPLLDGRTPAAGVRESAGRAAGLLEKMPAGPRFTKKLQASAVKLVRDSAGSGKPSPEMRQGLIEALSAIEADWRAASGAGTRPVRAGKRSNAAFRALASVTLKDVAKPGQVSLAVEHGLPAWADGLAPAWPILQYKLDFTGQLAKTGEVDMEFYVGGHAFSALSLRRVLEWDGKAYKDVTIRRDPKRGVITARTKRLATYVIM